MDKAGVELVRQKQRHVERARIPGDVAGAQFFRQTEVAEAARDHLRGVLANQEDGRPAFRTLHSDRLPLICGKDRVQQFHRSLQALKIIVQKTSSVKPVLKTFLHSFISMRGARRG